MFTARMDNVLCLRDCFCWMERSIEGCLCVFSYGLGALGRDWEEFTQIHFIGWSDTIKDKLNIQPLKK